MRFLSVIVSSLFLAVGISTAETGRQLASHEHAAQQVNFAIQGDQLYLELFAPAYDLVGFEHPPSTPEQAQAAAQAIAVLEQDGSIFRPDQDAGCRLHSVRAAWTGDEEHEEHENGGHAEFRASYTYICQDVDALDKITVQSFTLYPGVRKIEVQGLTGSGQLARTLTPENPVIDLRK